MAIRRSDRKPNQIADMSRRSIVAQKSNNNTSICFLIFLSSISPACLLFKLLGFLYLLPLHACLYVGIN